MKLKITAVVLGTTLFVACGSTSAHPPKVIKPLPPDKFVPVIIEPAEETPTAADIGTIILPAPVESSVVRVETRRAPLKVVVVQSASPKNYALNRIGSTQFACLDKLWTRESGWRTKASNPSGAYGIPQALPGSKMASAGSDWRTNPITQVKWGLSYIKARYGSACGAWEHFRSYRWY